MGTVAPPVFVVGAPRSGAALVYGLLCLHQNSVWVSNRARRAPETARFAARTRRGARGTRTRSRTWFDAGLDAPDGSGRVRSPLGRLVPRPAEGAELFDAYDLAGVSRSDPPSRRQLGLRRAVDDLVEGGARVFVSHAGAHTRRVRQLHALFPEARFVTLTRDGRAVAASLLHTGWWPDSVVWWYGNTPRAWEADGRDPWELTARHWVREVEALEAGLAHVPSGRILQLTYEQLVDDPERAMQQAGEFAGLADEGAWRRAMPHLPLSERDEEGWPGRLGDSIDRVQEIQEGWLRKYGYLP